MKKSGSSFLKQRESLTQIFSDIKETKSFVASRYSKDESKLKAHFNVDLNYETCTAPEILFPRKKLGLNRMTLIDGLNLAVGRGHNNFRSKFYDDTVLAGGNTTFPGFQKSILQGLNRFKIGPVLTSLSSFDQMHITKDDHEESGPFIVHQCNAYKNKIIFAQLSLLCRMVIFLAKL